MMIVHPWDAVGAEDSNAGRRKQGNGAVIQRNVGDVISCEMTEELDEGEAKSAACTITGEDYRRGGDGVGGLKRGRQREFRIRP